MSELVKQREPQRTFWSFRGHPLVRCGGTIYYGSPAEPFIIVLKILSTHDVKGLAVADKISVVLHDTDPETDPMKCVVRRCERSGLYSAVDIASVWLERELRKLKN